MTVRTSLDRARLQPPSLQTSFGNNSLLPQDSTTPIEAELDEKTRLPVKAGHQNFVLTDPVAFRYLEEDTSTTVLDRRRPLKGYVCYLVEQWTTSRSHPTFMITTYTGDPSHSVVVSVLSVPTDENVWSPRLRVYFKALNQFHARRRQTPLGILMVTNLSNFPSSLTVVPVPDGDIKAHRFDFFVNEDLKRLGCSGRVGLNLSQPAAATVAKFHQLYRTSEKNDIYKSVIELIKLCQSALTLFDKLEIDYADGLLCDVTERAVNDWWIEIGNEYYNVEPHDGILGPTTVAGLLGLLMGARNRLHSINAPVPKDPFDVEAMKKGIGAFQKQQRIARSRRLDRRTLERLHKTTQKAADKDRWTVPKAVKSTMAELSGKGGEMVMEAVGRRDKAGIAEVETVDMDRFVQLVYGDRAKWLWLGKAVKKHKTSHSHDRAPEDVQADPQFSQDLVFKSDDHGGFTWTAGRKSTADGLLGSKREQQRQDRELEQFNKPTSGGEADEDEEGVRPSIFKRTTTMRSDAKSGLDKVKGAVGLRGHKPQPSIDETAQTSPVGQDAAKSRRPLLRRALSSPVSSPNSAKGSEKEDRTMPAVTEHSNRLNLVLGRDRTNTAESRPMLNISEAAQREDAPSAQTEAANIFGDQQQGTETEVSRTATATASIAGSICNGVDLNEALPTGPETDLGTGALLQRTASYSEYVGTQLQSNAVDSFPRHLSFSLAEESILEWQSLIDDSSDPFYDGLRAQLARQELIAKESKQLRGMITTLHSETATWTSSQIALLQSVLEQCDHDQETLDTLREPHLASVRELQVQSEGILRNEKDRLEEGAKEIEMVAAKLQYEIDGLHSRVEDVDAAVTDFEKSVVRVEDSVLELETEGKKQGWNCIIQ